VTHLDGKVAVVSGAASGIGLAVARTLTEHGARVVVADRNEDAGRDAAATLGGAFVAADVGEPADWVRVVETAENELGGVDIAHLNAGVTCPEPAIEKLTDEQYRRIMRANVDGVVFGARAVVPAMERRGGGAIVATASLAGLIPTPFDPIYALTKHAVIGLVRSLVPHLQAKGIRVNAVCPGITDTPLVGAEPRAALEQAGFPLIPATDIAAAVLMAVSGDATGQAYVCQAGREPVPFEFRGVPGPRAAGAEGRRPPPGMGEV